MIERKTIGSIYPYRAGPLPAKPATSRSNVTDTQGSSFQNFLNDQMVRFSHHAEQRLAQRGIELKPEQLERLGGAIDKAAAKGAKDSLVLYQDLAFIVNVKNRTVITAMDGASMNDHVFTQIDSTIVVR